MSKIKKYILAVDIETTSEHFETSQNRFYTKQLVMTIKNIETPTKYDHHKVPVYYNEVNGASCTPELTSIGIIKFDHSGNVLEEYHKKYYYN